MPDFNQVPVNTRALPPYLVNLGRKDQVTIPMIDHKKVIEKATGKMIVIKAFRFTPELHEEIKHDEPTPEPVAEEVVES